MGDEQAAPETKGATSEVLATVDLGPEIEGMAGRQLRMRMVNIEPGGVFGRLRPARNDHRPSRWSRDGLWAGRGLARGSEHDTLAREQRNDSGGGDLGRHRQTRVSPARRDSPGSAAGDLSARAPRNSLLAGHCDAESLLG